MAKEIENNSNDEVKITHINPSNGFSDLEKTAILQFKLEQEEEKLSQTAQFKLLNKINDLTNTAKLNLLEIKEAAEDKLSKTAQFKFLNNKVKEDNDVILPKKKVSLYDTVVLKLESLIKRRSALNTHNTRKVVNLENVNVYKKKSLKKLLKGNNVNKFKINVDSDLYGIYLYELNKYALTILSKNKDKVKVREYEKQKRLNKIENICIDDDSYNKYSKKLNKFAINKLYYRIAPKETKKYKVYKFCVNVLSLLLLANIGLLMKWYYEGTQIKNISYSIKEDVIIDTTTIGEVIDSTTIDENPVVEENLYWKYLNTPMSSVNFDNLLIENNDTIGWIIVNNTNIDYPVVQTIDNDYYLNHAFNKSFNQAGWVYADFRNDFNNLSKNTVLYGHGRKDGVMFGSLRNTLNKDWYTNKDNQIIQFSTLKYNTMWQIFSIYKIPAESYYITTDFSSDSNYQTFLNTMVSRSIYNFNINVGSDDKILTLSTCYNDYGVRLVVHAKLVKIQER